MRLRYVGVVMLGLSWAVVRCAAAPPGGSDPHVQIFSSIDRDVVASNVSFTFTVDAYASVASDAEAASLVAAFARGVMDTAGTGLTLVRFTSIRRRRVTMEEDARDVLMLERHFVFRSEEAGALEVPSWRFTYAGVTYTTQPHAIQVYDLRMGLYDVRRSVLPVTAHRQSRSGRLQWTRTGSAFLVSPDALVTSYHVVMDAPAIRVGLPDGTWVTVDRAWALDPVRDVAVLYVDPAEVQAAGVVPLSLRALGTNPSGIAEPAVVYTSGWPGGVQQTTVGYHYRGMTLGPEAPLWISSNPVRPGDSGGPLIDSQGRVLGIVSSGSVVGRGAHVLRENLCVATDPRPALHRKLMAGRPRRLRRMFRDAAFSAEPHARLLRLSELVGRVRAEVDPAAVALPAAANAPSPSLDPGLRYLQASIYQSTGDVQAAAGAYQAALDLYGDHYPSAYMLALIHLSRRRYEQAEDLFRQTMRFEPYTHLAGYGLAQALVGQLEYAQAIPMLRAVLRHKPGFAPAARDLALVYLAVGDRQRSVQLLARLDETDPRVAAGLRRVLRHPALAPTALVRLGRVTIPEVDGGR